MNMLQTGGPSKSDQLYQQFMAAKRKQLVHVRIVQFIILFVCLGLWEVAGRLKWIDVLLFSYPSKIAVLLWNNSIDGSIFPHIGVTMWETIAGFILGTLFGTLLAMVIWWSPFLSKVLDPYLVVLNALPKVALGPLFIVGFGPGLVAIIATSLSISVIVTTLVVYGAFKEVDANFVKVIQVFGGDRKQVFRKVILPSSVPAIVSTLKVNVGLSWVGVIVGEFLVAKAGLGYLIVYGFQVFNFTLVLGTLMIIGLIATLMYQGVSYIERKVMKRLQ
ncbi:ABC transporter permease [Paenibacillus sp. N1-5-1-14]|uniref:ABC transporter permease n=1 Tax=Paenibacillus radicibacter TaxID=2972488 RepID=UPI0021590FFC|nr:ABC transporter permease [Paenibacillus radicibacter]MCR8641628.1 ABC transporter permease [Paenibacillus radicibacter]